MNDSLCVKCQGKGLCGRPCPILNKFRTKMPQLKQHFSGSSPPEIFVGRFGYPRINMGILSPQAYGNTEEMSMPELWHANKLNIEQILDNRSKLIYGRFKGNIRDAMKEKKLVNLMQEISLTSRSINLEVFLKKIPKMIMNLDSHTPLIGNPAPLESARLEENTKVERKADYLAGDTSVKSTVAINELYKGKIRVSNIIKMLSAGVLGSKLKRKFVPTRWSITAVDDTLSKSMLERIRVYPEISEFILFNADYLGNHYEIILMPAEFSFEVLEARMPGNVFNPSEDLYVSQDYESFSGRKDYAADVTGAYYANRLALCEYLEKEKHQASCLVMREVRPEYYAPCGVGILREASRSAFSKKPEAFSTIQDALKKAQTRMRLPISVFTERSWLLKNFGKQTKLLRFI